MKKYDTSLLNVETTCYKQKQIDKLPFMQKAKVTIPEILQSNDLPIADRVFAVSVLVKDVLTKEKLLTDFDLHPSFMKGLDLFRAIRILYNSHPIEIVEYLNKL